VPLRPEPLKGRMELNASLTQRIEEANRRLIVDHDADAVAEYFTADYVAHLTDQDMVGGHAAIRRVLRMYRQGFPDLNVHVDVLLEGADRIAWQRTLRGTHMGDYAGFPPTGRQIAWRDMCVSQFREGLIAEDWVISDLAERLLLARAASRACSARDQRSD
jgi:predicted ester cyclase